MYEALRRYVPSNVRTYTDSLLGDRSPVTEQDFNQKEPFTPSQQVLGQKPKNTGINQGFAELRQAVVGNSESHYDWVKDKNGQIIKKPDPNTYLKGLQFSNKPLGRNDMRRTDGSTKSSQGFLGPIKNNVDGGSMTEVSLQFDDVNNGAPIPALVPTLTEGEIKHLQNMNLQGNSRNIPRAITMKAINHANSRLKKGLNPFYQDGEQVERGK